METVRAFFRKTGRLKYISHLDVTRCISRVFNRCGLPIWFTQGFNPHPYLTFALPLPLGFDSECESFDFRLLQPMDYDIVRDRLNALLPRDLQVLKVAAPVESPEAICRADYRLTFLDENTEEVEHCLRELLAQASIPVTKKTKRAESQIDLKEHLSVLDCRRQEDRVILELRLPAGGTLNINPLLLTGALQEKLGREPYWTHLERTAVWDKNDRNFC